MASKGKVADPRSALAGASEMSVGDVLVRPPRKSARSTMAPTAEGGGKRPRIPCTSTPPFSGDFGAAAHADASVLDPGARGKFDVFEKLVRLTSANARYHLMGHGELCLDLDEKDYGEMQVYSGSSSSSEGDFAREDTYRIARSLGMDSKARLVVHVNPTAAGLLPGREGAALAEACLGAFGAPELERDLLKSSDLELMEAASFHAISVSD